METVMSSPEVNKIPCTTARVSSHLGRGRRPVTHIRVWRDVASGRFRRYAGQLACASDSRRPLDVEDHPGAELDCPKCKLVIETLSRRGVELVLEAQEKPEALAPPQVSVDRVALADWLDREVHSHGCYRPGMLDELASFGIRRVRDTLRAEGNEVEDGVHYDTEFGQVCFEGAALATRLCRLLDVKYLPAHGRGTQMRHCLDALRASAPPKAN